jgi:arginine repressor
MAKKQKVNKTQAVRDYLKENAKATNSEIAAALNKQGINLTANYVANIRTTIKKARTAKRAAKQQAAVEVAPEPEKTVKASPTVTLEQVKAVAMTVKALGGYVQVNNLLATIKDVGGTRKFKDLLEAMAGTEADAIPF